jgi:hypothetical protein
MRLSLALAIIATLLTAGCRLPAQEDRAELLGSYEWTRSEPWFGGFSAIELAENGADMHLLTDRAKLVRARILRDQHAITGIDLQEVWHLKSSSGAALSGRIVDSEGLAIAPGGPTFVSFEGVHRVAAYASPNGTAHVLTRARLFDGLEGNKSLEALAIDAQGNLFAIPEGGRDAQGNIPIYSRTAQGWAVRHTLPATKGFLPVAADFGPDGRLYLLERDFSVISFRSQLRRWDMTDGPQNETLLLRTAWGTHDNLEGLSVWRDPQGHLRATMISDDNFLPVQRTEIVEYRLP